MAAANDVQSMESILDASNMLEQTGESREVPPPAYDDPVLQCGPEEDGGFADLPTLDETAAREALMEAVAKDCCYSNSKARNLDIHGLDTSMIYKYTLKTMSEKRSYKLVTKPHPRDGPVDPPTRAGIPNVWTFLVQPNEMFKAHKCDCIIPHTDIVKVCALCAGSGRRTCYRCGGSGIRAVVSLIPVRPCYICGTSGQITCRRCAGRGLMKSNLRLDVEWSVQENTSNVRSTNWSLTCSEKDAKKLTKGSSVTLYENQANVVRPLSSSPDVNIPQLVFVKGREMLEEQLRGCTNQRTIQQYHKLSVIPVTQVTYQTKDRTAAYFIHGTERLVHFPNSGSCTII